jgi:Bacterial regulatory proteins, gntR family
LADGSVLPKEDELLVEFPISKPSLREAMRILEAEGLLSVRRGKLGGAVVHRPSAANVAYTMGLVLGAHEVSLSDVATALLQVEPILANHRVIATGRKPGRSRLPSGIDRTGMQARLRRQPHRPGDGEDELVGHGGYAGIAYRTGRRRVLGRGSAHDHQSRSSCAHLSASIIAHAKEIADDEIDRRAGRQPELHHRQDRRRPFGHVSAEPQRAKRRYTVISVDDHIVEPPDTFAGRLPRKFADRAPKVVGRPTMTQRSRIRVVVGARR